MPMAASPRPTPEKTEKRKTAEFVAEKAWSTRVVIGSINAAGWFLSTAWIAARMAAGSPATTPDVRTTQSMACDGHWARGS